MAFWDDFQDSASSLMDKLNADPVVLRDVVDDINCLNQLRDGNEKLITYFCQPEVLRELVRSTLDADIDETMNETEQYRYSHQCCEVITFKQEAICNALLDEAEVINFVLNYLNKNDNKLNHLTASFFSKIVLSLYVQNSSKTLELLSSTDFLESAIKNIGYSAIYELLLNLNNCIPPYSRDPVKKWMVDKQFGLMCVDVFGSKAEFAALENVCIMWSEFIKALREFCFTMDTPDELLNHLQSVEVIKKLLEALFPEDECNRDVNKISNGCIVLSVLLEKNYDLRQPGGEMNRLTEECPRPDDDPELLIEAECCKYLSEILSSAATALANGDGDVMARCMAVAENLTNTNQTQNHKAIVSGFKDFDFASVFDCISKNPMVSIFNSYVYNIICLLLHCAPSDDEVVLNYLFNDLKICTIVLNAFENMPSESSGLRLFAYRSFFLRIAERIEMAKEHSQNSPCIQRLMDSLPDYEQWNHFVDGELRSYLNLHLRDEVSVNQSVSDLSGNLNLAVDLDLGLDQLNCSGNSIDLFDSLSEFDKDPADDVSTNDLDQTQEDDTSDEKSEEQTAQEKSSDDDWFDQSMAECKTNAGVTLDDWPTTETDKEEELNLFQRLKAVTTESPDVAAEDWPTQTGGAISNTDTTGWNAFSQVPPSNESL